MAIVLRIKTDDNQISELVIHSKVILGRSSTSDYKIADAKMSGQHCSFEIDPAGQLVFMDLQSTNGSFLNNSVITNTLVRVNDIIRVGNTSIMIDEKRLNSKERLSVGVSKVNNLDWNESSGINVKEPKKKTIILSKDIKAKKRTTTSNWSSSENVLEQEESGHTKFLKLENKVVKKKS